MKVLVLCIMRLYQQELVYYVFHFIERPAVQNHLVDIIRNAWIFIPMAPQYIFVNHLCCASVPLAVSEGPSIAHPTTASFMDDAISHREQPLLSR